jgi:hypothetical protein
VVHGEKVGLQTTNKILKKLIMDTRGFNVSIALSCKQNDTLINSSDTIKFTCLHLLATDFYVIYLPKITHTTNEMNISLNTTISLFDDRDSL